MNRPLPHRFDFQVPREDIPARVRDKMREQHERAIDRGYRLALCLAVAMLATVAIVSLGRAQSYQAPPLHMPSQGELMNNLMPQRPMEAPQRSQTVCERAPGGQVVCYTR